MLNCLYRRSKTLVDESGRRAGDGGSLLYVGEVITEELYS